MTDIFAVMRGHVVAALTDMLPDQPPEAFARVVVEPPKDAAQGDMSTNAAMVVAKAAKIAPPKLAADLASRLMALPEVAEATPAGPGFLNLRLAPAYLRAQLPAVLVQGTAYGDGTPNGRRINVEYVSANPTGPMHVGHCRGAVVGDALARLLAKAGYDVTREYYINDAGAQVQALAWAAYWRYLEAAARAGREGLVFEMLRQLPNEAKGTVEAAFNVTLQYGGEYLITVGDALYEQFGGAFVLTDDEIEAQLSGKAWSRVIRLQDRIAEADDIAFIRKALNPKLSGFLTQIRRFTVAAMMVSIRADLAALGVEDQVFVSEAELIEAGMLDRAEERLRAQGLIYQGVLEAPKGKTPDDWEPREQTLFASRQFGDDTDRALRKSDGTGTYFANDIANHLHKVERGFDELVHVWGADHGGYVRRMKAAVAALTNSRVSLDVVLTQIVHVLKDGQPVRMSKRAGSYITLADLIEEVGRDAVRFTMLTRKADAQMEFDLDRVVEHSRDNPVFYVQYAHARTRSVLRSAGDPTMADLATAPLESLVDPAEMALIRRMATWPRVVEAAAAAREPHRVAFFLNDLAGDFHLLWNRGRDDSTLRFIRSDEPVATRARLALVAATGAVLRSGLAVMGVTPVEELRDERKLED